MTFAAETARLAEELVVALAGRSQTADRVKLKKRCNGVVHALRGNQHLRTNQFAVKNTLDGLEERWRIHDRDALADALRTRLDTLQESPAKWHPEILSLFLELSDQPTAKSRLRDLDDLHPPRFSPEESLRWEDIAKEDGWEEDKALWKSVSFSDSSDDELEGSDNSEASSESTSITPEEHGRSALDFIVQTQGAASFDFIKQQHSWRQRHSADNRNTPVSEAHVVRDVLFMLQGLPTTLFDQEGTPRPGYQMESLVWQTHRAVIGVFAEYGRQISLVRAFSMRDAEAPHLQIFQDCVARHLQSLDQHISSIQSELAAPREDIAVSLIAVKRELSGHIDPLCALSAILTKLHDAPNAGTFQYLEVLYQEVCISQLSGKTNIYTFLAKIFLECFDVYLRPIRLWMDDGRLIAGDEIFFVTELNRETPLGQIWHSRFLLRHAANGALHAPEFLRPAASKIFNAGKNIVVLRYLGLLEAVHVAEEPRLDFETICQHDLRLAPFAEIFGVAFDGWIQSKYRMTSTTLKEGLYRKCQLEKVLQDLHKVYLGSNGASTALFHDALFQKLDDGLEDWFNEYALTTASQEAFTSLADSDQLKIEVDKEARMFTIVEAAESVRTALACVRPRYRLSWPIQIVVSEESIAHYTSIATLLMQLGRATHALHSDKLRTSHSMSTSYTEEATYYSLRNNLVWFCSTFQTYLAILVLEPGRNKLRADLNEAPNVDSMIRAHEAFSKEMVDEACLSNRLQPIRECLLDIFDLALMLKRAKELAATSQQAQEMSIVEGTSDDERPRRPTKSGFKYTAALSQIKADFYRHLRFICEGLRSVARASSDARSMKWNMLAEMLQSGSQNLR